MKNCFIHHNTFTAFCITGCDETLIQNNIIEDNGNLIHGGQGRGVNLGGLEMRDNLIQRNGGYWSKPASKPGLQNKMASKVGINEQPVGSKPVKQSSSMKKGKVIDQ